VKKHSYIIVRNDLSRAQQLIQSCHAIWELRFRNKHPSLVVVVVKNENKLLKLMKILDINDIKYSIFEDSDLKVGITAIATEPLSDEKRIIFKKYQLLK